jgi:hypothetical protein
MFYVYMLVSRPQGTLYIGMTDDLILGVRNRERPIAASALPPYPFTGTRTGAFAAHSQRPNGQKSRLLIFYPDATHER